MIARIIIKHTACEFIHSLTCNRYYQFNIPVIRFFEMISYFCYLNIHIIS